MNRDRIEGLAVEPAVGQQLPASACVERLENSGSRSADKSEYEIVVGRMHHERVISVDVQTRHVIGQRSPVGRIDILPDSAVIPTEVYGRRVGGIGCRRLDASGNLVEAAFRVDGRGSDWGPFCGAQRDDTRRAARKCAPKINETPATAMLNQIRWASSVVYSRLCLPASRKGS